MTDYYKKAWTGVQLNNYQIKVCCEKLSKHEEIQKQADHWDVYGDGVYQVQNIIYCPFCGGKLP